MLTPLPRAKVGGYVLCHAQATSLPRAKVGVVVSCAVPKPADPGPPGQNLLGAPGVAPLAGFSHGFQHHTRLSPLFSAPNIFSATPSTSGCGSRVCGTALQAATSVPHMRLPECSQLFCIKANYKSILYKNSLMHTQVARHSCEGYTVS